MTVSSETFYQTISHYYEAIFPLNLKAVAFTKSHLPKGARVLDVGCATGAFSCAIAPFCQQLEAFDLNAKMIEIAGQKNCENVSFRTADMLKIKDTYHSQAFDVVSCYGNTLVHLLSEENISAFLRQTSAVLRDGGKLLLQLLNYDTILDKGIRSLPLIENEKVCFVRNYYFHTDNRLIDFETELYVKDRDIAIKNTSNLYALRPEELRGLILNAGFSSVNMYSSFGKDSLSNDKLPLVVEAYV